MPGSKITQLAALSTLTDDDLFVTVNSPGGSPVTMKTTYANLVSSLATRLGYKLGVIFGPNGTSGNDFTGNGTTDDTQLQNAINSVGVGESVLILAKPGSFVFGGSSTVSMNGRLVKLLGLGVGKTKFALSNSFGGGVLLREQTYTTGNIEVAGITFDLSGKANVGAVHLYQGDNNSIHDCEAVGQGFTSSSKWTFRMGNFVDGQASATQSRNCRFDRNYIHDCNCGTFEQLLFMGQADGFVQNNVWKGNTSSGAYQLMLYINNLNVDVATNRFEAGSANCIGVMESGNCAIHHNTQQIANSFNGITLINSQGIKVEDNQGQTTDGSNTAAFITGFDRLEGPDGHQHIFGDTQDISIRRNAVKGFKHGVSIQLTGTFLGTDYTMNHKNITFGANDFSGTLSSPIILGTDDATNFMQKIFIEKNNVLSWSGTGAGAIQLRGYSGDVSQMKDIYIDENFVAPSTGVGNSSAVRVIGCTVKRLADNKFEGAGIGFDAISTATGGLFESATNNLGFNPNKFYAQGNVSGTATVNRVNGNVIDLTLTADTTVTVAAGKVDGDKLLLRVNQDATGGWVLTFDASVRFGTDVADAAISTGSNKTDYLGLMWSQTDNAWHCAAIAKGY